MKTNRLLFRDRVAAGRVLAAAVGAYACYFNDSVFPPGQYLRSWSKLLHCEERRARERKGDMPCR